MNIEKTIEALKKNNMNASYCETREDVLTEIKKILKKGSSVACGGSVTLAECGADSLLKSGDYEFIDRFKPGLTEEQKKDVFAKILNCSCYFCSANAITQNGELVNVDGFSNRVSALCFGPEKVVVIAGKNKLVGDLKEAFLRIKSIAAPKNCVRLGKKTPCAVSGKCVSFEKSSDPGISDGCDSPDRICRDYVICGPQMIKGRITVLICGEDLGY